MRDAAAERRRGTVCGVLSAGVCRIWVQLDVLAGPEGEELSMTRVSVHISAVDVSLVTQVSHFTAYNFWMNIIVLVIIHTCRHNIYSC